MVYGALVCVLVSRFFVGGKMSGVISLNEKYDSGVEGCPGAEVRHHFLFHSFTSFCFYVCKGFLLN